MAYFPVKHSCLYNKKIYTASLTLQVTDGSITLRQHFNLRIACENIRFSSLFVAEDVSRGGTSATQRQKFHTDDVKSVQNLVRSADWSTKQLHCFSYCLRMTDKRRKATKVKRKREESLTKQSIFVEYSLL